VPQIAQNDMMLHPTLRSLFAGWINPGKYFSAEEYGTVRQRIDNTFFVFVC
jgi:hypothetical protein